MKVRTDERMGVWTAPRMETRVDSWARAQAWVLFSAQPLASVQVRARSPASAWERVLAYSSSD